jgi:hypothetical protein
MYTSVNMPNKFFQKDYRDDEDNDVDDDDYDNNHNNTVIYRPIST